MSRVSMQALKQTPVWLNVLAGIWLVGATALAVIGAHEADRILAQGLVLDNDVEHLLRNGGAALGLGALLIFVIIPVLSVRHKITS